MPMVGQLVEVTPYRLRYLITCTTEGEGPIDTFVIPNAFGATPDLRTDAFTAFGRSPIFNLVAFTPVPTDIQAMIRLCGDGAPNSLFSNKFLLERPRAHLYVTSRGPGAVGAATWSARPRDGASAGSAPSANFSVVEVTGPSIVFEQCYVDLDYEHTFHR